MEQNFVISILFFIFHEFIVTMQMFVMFPKSMFFFPSLHTLVHSFCRVVCWCMGTPQCFSNILHMGIAFMISYMLSPVDETLQRGVYSYKKEFAL